eukprot:6042349-Heterocapsa_arctica.AAC.1
MEQDRQVSTHPSEGGLHTLGPIPKSWTNGTAKPIRYDNFQGLRAVGESPRGHHRMRDKLLSHNGPTDY